MGRCRGEGALFQPSGVAALPGGDFLVTAWGDHRVFRYAVNGARSLPVGNGMGTCSAAPAGVPAVEQTTFAPRSAAVLGDGSLLVGEQGCHRLVQITSTGQLQSFAGTGTPGYSGDDGQAIMAALHAGAVQDGPSFGFALSPEDPPDELFVADTLNHVIREIALFTGRIETIAGTGQPGFNDGPLETATFDRPTHVFSGEDHSLWIVDAGNHAIRYIDPLFTRVTTVIGTGTAGFNGDNLSPTETQLTEPTAVWVTPDQRVFVADAGNNRIRLFQDR